MIIDTSVLMAIILKEPEELEYTERINSEPGPRRMSCASYLEAGIVVDRDMNPVLSKRLDRLIEALGIDLEPVTPSQVRIARQAYATFGKGTGHKAQLNFGDCFAYALAEEKREPILFKGNDFNHTDLRLV